MRKRVKVSLELAVMSVDGLVTFSNHTVEEIGLSGYFTTPHPALSVVLSAVSELQTAEAQAQGGGTAKTEIVRVKREIVENLLTELGHYVEDIANLPGNETIAELIILSAGMKVKRFTPRQKKGFSIKPSGVGAVKLTAEKVIRGSHEWQYTATPGSAASWIDAGLGTKASITISGLTSGVRYYFRHRRVLKTGPTEWDGPENTIVL